MRPEFRCSMAISKAAQLWRTFGFTSPKELVLEDLAFTLGVLVIEAYLDTADARLVRRQNKGIIRVNQAIPQLGRKRFAIAHELGHWFLHADLSQILACTNEEMSSNYRGSEPEIEANYFAAELLMPSDLFSASIRATQPTPDVIHGLADEYQTTRTATAVRYVELSDDYCVMIIARNGCIGWWRVSKPFEKELWFVHGAPVSPRTLAGRFFSTGLVSTEPQEISICEWADRYPDFAESVVEAAIPLGTTGDVLTLLWLL